MCGDSLRTALSSFITRHNRKLIQKWFVKVGVEELHLAEQSPELNPIKHCDSRIVISSQCVIKKYS